MNEDLTQCAIFSFNSNAQTEQSSGVVKDYDGCYEIATSATKNNDAQDSIAVCTVQSRVGYEFKLCYTKVLSFVRASDDPNVGL